MQEQSVLFTPLSMGPVVLPNRIIISPMCQYSADQGRANAWHHAHLGSLSVSGVGLLCFEATAVQAIGRITPQCLGLYDDENQAAMERLVRSVREISSVPLCMQLAHAGRKASSASPWNGGKLIPTEQGGWVPVAPSARPHAAEEPPPTELDVLSIERLINDFQLSAERAVTLGFDVIELHMAHGYLLHQFLSAAANHRTDEYGGSLENRMRLPLQVFEAVRDAAGSKVSVGVRISASDWLEDGWDVPQSIALCKALEASGCHFIDVSSGGISPHQKIELGPGYQVPFATAIKNVINIPVIAVGLITEPAQAEEILTSGKADAIAMARAFLADPRWPWRAAAELGGTVQAPPQYWRSAPTNAPDIFGKTKTDQR